MGNVGSCRRQRGDEVDPVLQPFDAGKIDDYGIDEIKEVKITDKFSVLVSQHKGKFYAYGSKCPHYGAPLAKGALVDGMIRCPWHGACFDIQTGDIEDHPGTYCIPTYRVEQSPTGALSVFPTNFGKHNVERPLGKVKNHDNLFVVLGAGPASLVFVQTLRENNFEGRIMMVTKDSHLPYDRPKLSKSPGISWNDIKLRDTNWYKEADIEVMLNTIVERVNFDEKKIYLKDKDPIIYNQLLIATGLRPRMPPSEGTRLKNIFSLHSIEDGAKIKEGVEGKEVVIVGSGFIGMELSSSLQSHCTKITILSRSQRPYGAGLGETVGKVVEQRILEKFKNIEFLGRDGVKEIFGNEEEEVAKVITTNGKEIVCQAVIYAIGALPNTEFVNLLEDGSSADEEGNQARPLNLTPNGFITTNEFLETNVEGVWAAGDIARIPLNLSVSKWATIAHFGIAQKSGRIAALSVVGIKESIFNTVPFFWTSVAGISIRYVGYGDQYNKSVVFGDLENLKFCIVYRKDEKILALCTCNCDPIAARMAFDMQEEVDWGEGYPSYILEAFPNPPVMDTDLN